MKYALVSMLALQISFVTQGLASPVPTPMFNFSRGSKDEGKQPASSSSKHAYPEHVQHHTDRSSAAINKAGGHRVTQSDEAIGMLKLNKAPSDWSRDDNDREYMNAVTSLRELGPEMLEHVQAGEAYTKQLKKSKYPRRSEAKQHQHDLEMAAKWTGSEGYLHAPHNFIHAPKWNPEATVDDEDVVKRPQLEPKMKAPQLDPEEREAVILHLQDKLHEAMELVSRPS